MKAQIEVTLGIRIGSRSLVVPGKSLSLSQGTRNMTTKNRSSNTPGNEKEHLPFTVYLAGDLWTHKDLIGNALLGDYINKVSEGKYKCVLPQDLESPVQRDVDVRNVDLKGVIAADMAIFNFDGTDLDSGTVVEFMYAKMLDIPSVILRTDFRSSGEGNQDQDPWNLMATHWPRSKVVILNGMEAYQDSKSAGDLSRLIEQIYTNLAERIVRSLEEVRSSKPIAGADLVSVIFDWALEYPGSGFRDLFQDGEIEDLIASKRAKGLLSK